MRVKRLIEQEKSFLRDEIARYNLQIKRIGDTEINAELIAPLKHNRDERIRQLDELKEEEKKLDAENF